MFKEKEKEKRIVAILLVVANIFCSLGFETFAYSVQNIVYETRVSAPDTKNYYSEFIEEYYYSYESTKVSYLQNDEEIGINTEEDASNYMKDRIYQEADINEDGSIDYHLNDDNVESEEELTDDSIIQEVQEDEETTTNEQELENEDESKENNNDELENIEDVSEVEETEGDEEDENSLDENQPTTQNDEENDTTIYQEEPEEEEQEIETEEVEDIINLEEETNFVFDEEEDTEEGIEENIEENIKENKTENEEEIKTTKESFELNEEEDRELISTDSDIEEVISEETISTSSDAEELSEINDEEKIASMSHAKEDNMIIATTSSLDENTTNIIYATISKVNWTVKQILIDTNTIPIIKSNIINEQIILNILAKTIDVLLVDDYGNEKIITIEPSWIIEEGLVENTKDSEVYEIDNEE